MPFGLDSSAKLVESRTVNLNHGFTVFSTTLSIPRNIAFEHSGMTAYEDHCWNMRALSVLKCEDGEVLHI